MILVRDTDTDRTGKLVKRPGHVLGSSYVNPTWNIEWDDVEDIEYDVEDE